MVDNRYQSAKVYKIINLLDKSKYYIGSTIKPLNLRFIDHKSSAKMFPKRPLYKDMLLLGYDKFKIELVLEYPCNCSIELREKEGEYIRNLRPIYNKRNAFTTPENMKQWNHQYKITIKRCDCGKDFTLVNHSRHCRSKFHIDNDNVFPEWFDI